MNDKNGMVEQATWNVDKSNEMNKNVCWIPLPQ